MECGGGPIISDCRQSKFNHCIGLLWAVSEALGMFPTGQRARCKEYRLHHRQAINVETSCAVTTLHVTPILPALPGPLAVFAGASREVVHWDTAL